MRRVKRLLIVLLNATLAVLPAGLVAAEQPAARELIAAAIDLTRGRSSYAEFAMVIHRPDWERSSSLVAWTRGRKDALIRFTAPAKDAGNATLKQGEKMWTYNPKLNRTDRKSTRLNSSHSSVSRMPSSA